MRILSLHPWKVQPAEALQIQKELAERVSAFYEPAPVRLVAGADMAIDRIANRARAAVVVLAYPELTVVEKRMAEVELSFPYIPGLLSFREAPALLSAFEKLHITPDVLLADGQGLAHPRLFGIACHLGVLLGLPAIGCAKSLLVGKHESVGESPGSRTDIMFKGEVVGAAVRTRAGARPLYISIGHKMDLETAIRLVLSCTRGHRLPEPTRLADRAAAGPAEDWNSEMSGATANGRT